MALIDEVGIFAKAGGNNFDLIATATGTFGLVVQQGKGVTILREGLQQTITFDVPQIHVGRLNVVAGELVIDYTAFLGSLPGTSTDNPDRPWRRLHTLIQCGPRVGDFVTGTTPAPAPGGTVSAPVDLGPILAKLDALATAVDALQTDLVGRLKQHDGNAENDMHGIVDLITKLPDTILGETPAGDHYGLDPRAQFGNRWQELFGYVLTERQDFWQVVTERLFEAWRNMQAEGFDPATGEYHKP